MGISSLVNVRVVWYYSRVMRFCLIDVVNAIYRIEQSSIYNFMSLMQSDWQKWLFN